jgi:hypothetical protein
MTDSANPTTAPASTLDDVIARFGKVAEEVHLTLASEFDRLKAEASGWKSKHDDLQVVLATEQAARRLAEGKVAKIAAVLEQA